MPLVQEARPPYVHFEYRPVEDRAASVAAGHYVAKDVAYAIVTPAGSRDRHEKIAEEWLDNMADQVRQERLPAEWLAHYRALYKAWKEGREAPENGTAIRNWPVASPAQVETLLNLRIRTVEDLATCNEEAITRMGMGGRALKQKAIDWLASAASNGKSVEAITTLRADFEALRLKAENLEARNAELERKIIALTGTGEAGSTGNDDDDDIQLEVRLPVGMKKL
jgi:hypothetical protein